jgi:lysophospholipase
LRAVSWAEPALDRGTVLILQGRAEFIEKYFETVSELRARRFCVAAFDWRGQGGSDRAVGNAHKGHVGDFAEYGLDLAAIGAFLDDRRLPAPRVALAHSMGGCVALLAAAAGALPADKLVALAPMVELSLVRHPRTARGVVRTLCALGFGERFVPGGTERSISTLPFPGNRLSADKGRSRRNAEVAAAMGAGAVGAPTIAWLDAAYRAMAVLGQPGLASRLTTPTLLVAAGDDPICSTPAVARFGAALPSGPTLVIPGSRHEILMETDDIRRTFWAAFDAFLADPAAACEGPRLPGQAPEHLLVETGVAAGDDRAARDR